MLFFALATQTTFMNQWLRWQKKWLNVRLQGLNKTTSKKQIYQMYICVSLGAAHKILPFHLQT